MHKLKDIVRLKLRDGRTHREIARTIGVSAGSVGHIVRRLKASGLDWEAASSMSNALLEARLYPAKEKRRVQQDVIDFAQMDLELRKKGVTLSLLHLEYLERHPTGYQYSQFCKHYRDWKKKQKCSMRQVHKAGAKMFVDYAGLQPEIVDPQTGEVHKVELFVAVLGASSYTYAEATRTQQSEDFCSSHIRAFEYFGGVTEAVVPDQLKSGVQSSCRYEPAPTRAYQDMARHMGCIILPARPRKPKDKAKVEVAVQVAERWILARLRNDTFFNLAQLNERIHELLEVLNDRVMKDFKKSRRDLFFDLDKPALKPLPTRRYVYGEWKKAKVSVDYHVELSSHYYSVPHQYIGETVELRHTATTVEVFFKGKRLCAHPRAYKQDGRHTTEKLHMPKEHRGHAEWTPQRMMAWAQNEIGEHGRRLALSIIKARFHPEQAYRSILGLIRLTKYYEKERVNRACKRALELKTTSYKSVANILKNKREVPEPEPAQYELFHQNVRGADYYQQERTNNVD